MIDERQLHIEIKRSDVFVARFSRENSMMPRFGGNLATSRRMMVRAEPWLNARGKRAGSFENTSAAATRRTTVAIHQCRGTRDFDREFGYPRRYK